MCRMDSQPGKASDPGSPAPAGTGQPGAPGDGSPAGERREREQFFGAAKLIAALTVGSRVLGLVRDMAITSLGANIVTDSFVLAFRVPNFFRRLFGEGALSGAFVPVFSDVYAKDGPQAAGRLFANAFGLLAAFLILLMAVIQIGLLIWRCLAPGQPDLQYLLMLAVIMLPFMVTICLLALGGSALNCRGYFWFPALAPMILNVFMIAAAWWVGPKVSDQNWVQFLILSISVTLAGIFQLGCLLAVLKRHGLPIRPRLFPAEPGIKAMLTLLVPTVLGLGFPQLSQLLEGVIIKVFSGPGMPLPLGSQTRIYAASQLYQLPMGVLAISLGVAVFPLLSRYALRGDKPNFRQAVNRAIRISFMEGVASGVGLLVLAEPIIRLIYQRGKFTGVDAQEAAGILAVYVLGMWAYCSYQIFLKAFYSLKETKSPLKIVAVMAVLDLGLVLGLIWVPGLGARAFGVATVASMSFNVICLAVMLRRRVGLLGGRQIAASALRSLTAAGFMAAVVLALRYWLLPGVAGVSPADVASWKVVAVCVPVGAAAFLAAAAALRMPELRELLGRERE
jgi:putative peptidoglycan lipid II flippase